jgi:hypothetical protein
VRPCPNSLPSFRLTFPACLTFFHRSQRQSEAPLADHAETGRLVCLSLPPVESEVNYHPEPLLTLVPLGDIDYQEDDS